jgi:hypothetical protein
MKVRLLDIAHARSGDKGDTANVGVIALKPEWYEVIRSRLSLPAVEKHFAGVITGGIDRYELPNLNALNFLLHGALDGGGTLSLKTDAQGKVFSTAMLRMVIDVPDAEAESLGLPPSPTAATYRVSIMETRSIVQLALLFIGLVVWGYGQRVDDARLTCIGIGCFAIATVLRFLKRRA